MAFDQETAETIAPVLALIGQESRLDPNWTCHMLEAVSDQVLPDFYRLKRDTAATDAGRCQYGFRLVSSPSAGVDDIALLAHAFANDERLSNALYWVSRAIEYSPKDGELHRFKASILERMGRFDEALQMAKEAMILGADAEAISSDIARIETQLVRHLTALSNCSDSGSSLAASMQLLSMGRLKFPELIGLIGKIVRAYAKKN